MKKNLQKAIAVFFVLILIAAGLPIAAAAAGAMPGDLDNDRKVSSADARLVLRASVGLEVLDASAIALADVDCDGKVTAADARYVLRAAVGLEDLSTLKDRPAENKTAKDLLMNYLFDGSTQTHSLYEFFEDGTGQEYYSAAEDKNIRSRTQLEPVDTFTYELRGDQLIINGRIILDFVKKTDCKEYYYNGQPVFDSFYLLPEIPYAFYQTAGWDFGGPSDQPAYFVPVLALSSLVTPVTPKGKGVMTHDEYVAAALDTEVTIETYVQAKQEWWENTATFYTQDQDGAYFIYSMPCTKQEYHKLVPGTKIRVKGFKSEWCGEIEITDAAFEILDGSFIAKPADLTALLGAEDLIDHQNERVAFRGLTVEASTDADGNKAAFLYNYDGSGSAEANSDLYFRASVNGEKYTFTVESYLCGSDTDVYKAVEGLKVGDVIDVEGFLYWYHGANTHVTGVTIVG